MKARNKTQTINHNTLIWLRSGRSLSLARTLSTQTCCQNLVRPIIRIIPMVHLLVYSLGSGIKRAYMPMTAAFSLKMFILSIQMCPGRSFNIHCIGSMQFVVPNKRAMLLRCSLAAMLCVWLGAKLVRTRAHTNTRALAEYTTTRAIRIIRISETHTCVCLVQ